MPASQTHFLLSMGYAQDAKTALTFWSALFVALPRNFGGERWKW